MTVLSLMTASFFLRQSYDTYERDCQHDSSISAVRVIRLYSRTTIVSAITVYLYLSAKLHNVFFINKASIAMDCGGYYNCDCAFISKTRSHLNSMIFHIFIFSFSMVPTFLQSSRSLAGICTTLLLNNSLWPSFFLFSVNVAR